MDIFLQQLINGLVLGSVYALIALGYTMVYGILELINFAHGEITMIGAMLALAVISHLAGTGLPTPLVLLAGLIAAMAGCSALGYAIERIAYRPLRHAPRLAPLITAIGVSIVLQNLAMLIWGRQYISFPPLLPQGWVDIHGARLTDVQIIILLTATVLMLALDALIRRTSLGRAMRATAQSPQLAGLMGINANHIISMTFILGSALAAIGGFLVSAYYGLAHYYMGFLLGLKAFSAAVLGGIGNLRGAMLGGLLLGVIESMGAGYIGNLTHGLFGSNYQDVFAFFVLITVLIIRPAGLLGQNASDRA